MTRINSVETMMLMNTYFIVQRMLQLNEYKGYSAGCFELNF
jgi:hypothetical protein